MTEKSLTEKVCRNCKFLGRSDHWHSLGLHSGPACHYNPPALGNTGEAEWPLVDADEHWCGSYSEIERPFL